MIYNRVLHDAIFRQERNSVKSNIRKTVTLTFH